MHEFMLLIYPDCSWWVTIQLFGSVLPRFKDCGLKERKIEERLWQMYQYSVGQSVWGKHRMEKVLVFLIAFPLCFFWNWNWQTPSTSFVGEGCWWRGSQATATHGSPLVSALLGSAVTSPAAVWTFVWSTRLRLDVVALPSRLPLCF